MGKQQKGPKTPAVAAGKERFKLITENRKARHLYAISDEIEAGIVLTGTEVKSCRAGKAQLSDAYAMEHHGEIYLQHADISPYAHGNIHNHEPKRLRKLLLHKGEIEKLYGKLKQKGLTLIPLKLYFKGARVKVLLGLAKGKKLHDKREDLKKKTHQREMQQAFKERSRK